jgi:hypothetical protein
MHGLVMIEGMTLSGHPWIINEICFLFLTKEAYSHGGLQTGKLGQTPLSVDQPQSEY